MARAATLKSFFLLVALAAAGTACRLTNGERAAGELASNDTRDVSGRFSAMIQPLVINPAVSLAERIKIDERRSLCVTKTDIFYQEGDDYYPVVIRGYPLLVGLSPARSQLAFIGPAGFEQVGNLFVFDFEKKSLRCLTAHEPGESQTTVKLARWRDRRTLYYIEGYAFGTVSRGGSLYRIRADGTDRERIYARSNPDERPQLEVVDFEFAPGNLTRLVLEESNGAKEGAPSAGRRVVYIDHRGQVVKP